MPTAKTELVDPRVSAWIDKARRAGLYDQTLQVDIALNIPDVGQEEPTELGEAEVQQGQTLYGVINGRRMAQEQLNAYADSLAEQQRAARAVGLGWEIQKYPKVPHAKLSTPP